MFSEMPSLTQVLGALFILTGSTLKSFHSVDLNTEMRSHREFYQSYATAAAITMTFCLSFLLLLSKWMGWNSQRKLVDILMDSLALAYALQAILIICTI